MLVAAMSAITTVRVTTSDGLSLAALDAGPRDAPACVFLHGIAQSKQIWQPLLAGPFAHDHRLVALDLRGHGDSDRDDRPGLYTRPALAADLAAALDGLGLERPTVVAWSFGGVVVGEYLRRHGDAALGGIVFAAASVRTGRPALDLFGPVMLGQSRALLSEDAATYEAGARAFLQGCTAGPLAPDLLEAAVAEMLRVPAYVRRPLLAGGEDYTPEIARTEVPLATLHGDRDAVVLPVMSDLITSLRPGVSDVRLAGVGHVPWLESPASFEHALRSLLTR